MIGTIKFDVKGLDALRAKLSTFSDRRLRATVATALSRTAVQVRDAARAELNRTIDRPTPYTQRGIFIRTASAEKLQARVWYGDEPVGRQTPQARYLYPQIHGGGRNIKRYELAMQATGAMPRGWFSIPGPGAQIDKYGNVRRGQIQQILSQVGTELVSGHTRTLRQRPGETDAKFRSRKNRAYGKAGGQYLALPNGRGKLPPGVYLAKAIEGPKGGPKGGKKVRLGFKRSGALVPVLFFVNRVQYRSRYPFYEAVDRKAREAMPAQVERAVREQIDRMNASRR